MAIHSLSYRSLPLSSIAPNLGARLQIDDDFAPCRSECARIGSAIRDGRAPDLSRAGAPLRRRGGQAFGARVGARRGDPARYLAANGGARHARNPLPEGI